MHDLLFLLKNAKKREDAVIIEEIIWLAWNSHENPQVAKAMREGAASMKRGNTSGAVDAFSRASLIDPTFAEAHNKLAALSHKLSRHASCAVSASACLDILPHHFGALAGRGMALERSGDKEGAVNSLRTALEYHPWASFVPTVLQSLLLEISESNENKTTRDDGSDGDDEVHK